MDQDDSIIILDDESTNSSLDFGNKSVSSIIDDELLLNDSSSFEILEQDLEIVEVEVEEKVTSEVNRIQKEVEAFSPERKEVEVIFDLAEEKLRRDEEALKKFFEEFEEIEEERPAPSSLELDTSELILNTENDSEVLEEVGGSGMEPERKRTQETAELDTSVQVLDSEKEADEEKEEMLDSDVPSNEDFKKPVLSKGDTVYVDYDSQV